MTQPEIIHSFKELGRFLEQFQIKTITKNTTVKNNDLFFDKFLDIINQLQSYNGWFTPENVRFSLQNWAKALTEENINNWLLAYNFSNVTQKNVGLVLAGNIPLVGFHDFLSVILAKHKAIIKTSSNDQKLLPFLVNYLIALDARFSDKIEFVEGKLENFDAVIATGSNNTARYFEYYFKNKPAIIRKNRNSVAILTGNETKEELTDLGEDIFRYFGLGCRNVSKIFVPENYDFTLFFEAIFPYGKHIQYKKYANNYDYNKAVFLMSNYQLLDNEFLLLKEDKGNASPIGVLFYEKYQKIEDLHEQLVANKDAIQCIVSKKLQPHHILFGKTQHPELSDYADGIDTLQFLIDLK